MAKGLFRLWAVLAALWIIALSWEDPARAIEMFPNVAGPPLVILAIGAALVWAFRGFRSQ